MYTIIAGKTKESVNISCPVLGQLIAVWTRKNYSCTIETNKQYTMSLYQSIVMHPLIATTSFKRGKLGRIGKRSQVSWICTQLAMTVFASLVNFLHVRTSKSSPFRDDLCRNLLYPVRRQSVPWFVYTYGSQHSPMGNIYYLLHGSVSLCGAECLYYLQGIMLQNILLSYIYICRNIEKNMYCLRILILDWWSSPCHLCQALWF